MFWVWIGSKIKFCNVKIEFSTNRSLKKRKEKEKDFYAVLIPIALEW